MKFLRSILLALSLAVASPAFAQLPAIDAVAGPSTSAQLRRILTDETGTGVAIFGGGDANTLVNLNGSAVATGTVAAARLPNAGVTTINGVSCSIGGICTITASAHSITVGVTDVLSGTPNGLLYNDAGDLGNLATSASGVLVTSAGGVPSISTTLPDGLAMGTPASLTLTNATGLPNAGLVNSSTTVNGQTCTLGLTCTITATASSLVPGTTTLTGGALNSNGLLFNSGNVLTNLASGNNGVLVTNGSGVPSISTTLPGGLVWGGAFTYGGVTLNNAVTGTGNMVLSQNPTVNVTATGSTTARSLADRFATTKDPRDFGAMVDGSTDDTAAWNLAAAAIQAAGGGAIIVPAGFSRVDGPINYTGEGLAIIGSGYNSTIFKTGTTGNWLNVSGNKVTLAGFLLDAPNNASAGTIFSIATNGGNVTITEVAVDGGYDVLTLGVGAQLYISDSTFNNFTHNGIRPGPLWGGLTVIANVNMNVDGQVNTGSCLYLESGDTFSLVNINAASCNAPIRLEPQTPSPGVSSGVLVNVFAVNVFADGVGRTSGSAGWTMNGSAPGVELRRIRVNNSWAGVNIGNGFQLVTVDDVSIANSISINNGGHGIYMTAGNTNVNITGNTITGNSIIAPNTNSGVYIEDFGASDFIINNNLIKPTAGAANNQQYGINIVGPNSDRYSITGNDLAGNATGAISDGGAGPSKTLFNNFGSSNYGTTGTGAAALSASPTFTGTVGAADVTATGTVRANTGFNANGTAGASGTKTVRDAAGTGTCTLVFTLGLYTGGTC